MSDHFAGCPVFDLADEMNRLGVEGCRQNRAGLLARMREIYGDVQLTDEIRAALPGVPLDPLDVIGSIFDESIRRVEVSAA